MFAGVTSKVSLENLTSLVGRGRQMLCTLPSEIKGEEY